MYTSFIHISMCMHPHTPCIMNIRVINVYIFAYIHIYIYIYTNTFIYTCEYVYMYVNSFSLKRWKSASLTKGWWKWRENHSFIVKARVRAVRCLHPPPNPLSPEELLFSAHVLFRKGQFLFM